MNLLELYYDFLVFSSQSNMKALSIFISQILDLVESGFVNRQASSFGVEIYREVGAK